MPRRIKRNRIAIRLQRACRPVDAGHALAEAIPLRDRSEASVSCIHNTAYVKIG
jgi:hypothetical protein